MIDTKTITRDAVRAQFAGPATATIPGGAPVAVRAIGPDQRVVEFSVEGDLVRSERRTVVSLFRDEMPSIPSGTVVVIAGTSWTVDGSVSDDGAIATMTVHAL